MTKQKFTKSKLIIISSVLLFLIFAVCFIVFAKQVYAERSDEFVNYVSNKIYKDCNNKDLKINKVYYDTKTPRELAYLVSWPYAIENLNNALREFNKIEWVKYEGGVIFQYGKKLVGKEILTCSSHQLDINGNDWHWDGVEIEMPKVFVGIKATSGDNSPIVETHGNNSPVIIGDESKTNINSGSLAGLEKFIKNNIIVSIIIIILFIVSLRPFAWFKIWIKNKYIIFKYKREKVENSKTMYIARCEESPEEVHIIDEKNDRKSYNHIKDQFTRRELGFSHGNTSANNVASFSKKGSDFSDGKFKTIEIINLREKIIKDLEIIQKFKKLFGKSN